MLNMTSGIDGAMSIKAIQAGLQNSLYLYIFPHYAIISLINNVEEII